MLFFSVAAISPAIITKTLFGLYKKDMSHIDWHI